MKKPGFISVLLAGLFLWSMDVDPNLPKEDDKPQGYVLSSESCMKTCDIEISDDGTVLKITYKLGTKSVCRAGTEPNCAETACAATCPN